MPLALKSLAIDELDDFVADLGEPAYRASQLRGWLYSKLAIDFEEMSNLPASLRTRLTEVASVCSLTEIERRSSESDGSTKLLFGLADGESVEAVLLAGEKHSTLCISSQVGCALACTFCETGSWGFKRNLTQDEIIDQVVMLMRLLPRESVRPNLVFMGMGEPLLNEKNLLGALRVLTDERALAFGGRRITVSTIGIPDRIRALADTGIGVNLAVSLNAPDDSLRTALMPDGKRHTIRDIIAAAEYFAHRRGRSVTMEYVLFSGINDGEAEAAKLRRLLKRRPLKINLIPFNPPEQVSSVLLPGRKHPSQLRRPTTEAVRGFATMLGADLTVTVRWSQGRDVGGACGQLRGRPTEE